MSDSAFQQLLVQIKTTYLTGSQVTELLKVATAKLGEAIKQRS